MTDQTSIRDMLFYKSIFYITGVNAKIAASNSFTIVKRASAVWKLQPRVRFPLARHLFLSTWSMHSVRAYSLPIQLESLSKRRFCQHV